MFESLVAVTSPRRSALAAPAAALAHGLAFAGLVTAALWNGGEISLPDPPVPDMVFRVALPPAGGGGGHPGPAAPRRSEPPRARSASFPNRLPSDPAPSLQSESLTPVGNETAAGGDDRGTGTGDSKIGPGTCPDCPIGEPSDDPIFPAGGKVTTPVLVHSVDPVYPELERRTHTAGTVVIRAIIGKDGSIEETSALTATSALFEAEALRAIRQWRYRPGTLSGQPVRVLLQVVVNFRLR